MVLALEGGVRGLIEASRTHFKTKLLAVSTKVCGSKVFERQLLHLLCVYLKSRGVRNRRP